MSLRAPSESPRSRPRLFVAVVGGLWLALAGAEVVHLVEPFTYPYPPGRRPAGEPTPYRRSAHRTLRGDRGGDLTRMLGFRLTGLFAVPRGDIEVWTDRRGYRNEPRLADAHCPVAVTGDSFMDQGLTNADTPAGQLSRLLGIPVYDHTYMARGPATGVRLFLSDPEFEARPPRVLVWGFVGRSAHARNFRNCLPRPPETPPTRWGQLKAFWDRLRLPETDRGSYRYAWKRYTGSAKWSLLRAGAVALRAEATYRLERRFLTDKVLLGERPDGQFALFLEASVRSLRRTPKQRGLAEAAAAIAQVDAACRQRGSRLIILLIPDKAHVYPHWLGPSDRPRIATPNALDALGRRLVRRRVEAVNLLPVFLARNGDDEPLLYYPDDTHWSEHGIRVAMEALATHIQTPRTGP